MRKAYEIICRGKVQGVFYRASAKEEADMLNLVGWVKNIPNGEVHMYAEGEDEDIQRFIYWCERGPIYSKVSEVLAEETYFEEGHTSFEIKRD